MVAGHRLTIQDYFRRAGYGDEGASRRPPRIGLDGQQGDFRQVLEGIALSRPAAVSSVPAGGMRMADYWKSPIAAKAPLQPALDPIAPAGGEDLSCASGSPSALPVAPQPSLASAESCAPVGSVETASPTVDSRISASIRSAAKRYNLPVDLIRGVIRAESNFQADAVSPAGARGLMQLMPATARDLGVEDPFDIEQNIDGGARYLRQMLDMFGGNLQKALSAYNAGPGTAMRYNGDVPYRETRDYVRKVIDDISMKVRKYEGMKVGG